ncbi:hypothetical protein HZS_2718 [Henneguya salminicola]|nr:hypothetical protein HZS_2718 [Henneguya salminicola]
MFFASNIMGIQFSHYFSISLFKNLKMVEIFTCCLYYFCEMTRFQIEIVSVKALDISNIRFKIHSGFYVTFRNEAWLYST